MDAHYGPVEDTSLKVLLDFGSDPSDLAMRAAVFICDLYNYQVSCPPLFEQDYIDANGFLISMRFQAFMTATTRSLTD